MMKQVDIYPALLSATLILSVGQLHAQDVAPEIEALVSELAAEGYTEFTLEDSIFTAPTLVAEKDGVLLELELDPDTLEINQTTVALDEDGDGEVSTQERRRGITADELPAQASDRARAAVAAARERQRERQELREQDRSNGGNAPDAAVQERPQANRSGNGGGNAGGNGGGNGGGNAGGNGGGNGGGNAGGNGGGNGGGNAGGNGGGNGGNSGGNGGNGRGR